MRKTGDKR